MSGDVSIAYSVVGDGPFDVVFIGGWVLSSLEFAWEGPAADFFANLASFSRLILFDKRGTGLSDRVTGIPDLETRMDDVRAVMDAAGSRRAAIIGYSEGGPMTMLFSASHPERAAATIVLASGASYVRAEDYPWAPSEAEWEKTAGRSLDRFGTAAWLDEQFEYWAPSLTDDDRARRWWHRWVLTSASPGALAALRRMNMSIDVRHVLPAIHAPTLVMQRVDDQLNQIEESRYVAERIADAQLVELPGEDHAFFVEPKQLTSKIEQFLTGVWDRGEWEAFQPERVLATLLFTDIVDSTVKLVESGDRRWRDILEEHHAVVRRQLARFSGREVKTIGDGFFATFDGPARAIRCASAIIGQVAELGLELRAGLHTGECEILADDVRGIAVHIAARIAAEAESGELLVSSTVKDLVAGSGIQFREHGVTDLKGIPGDWPLYELESLP